VLKTSPLGMSVNRGNLPPSGVGESTSVGTLSTIQGKRGAPKGSSHGAETQEEVQEQRSLPTREGCGRSPDHYRAGVSILAPVECVLNYPYIQSRWVSENAGMKLSEK